MDWCSNCPEPERPRRACLVCGSYRFRYLERLAARRVGVPILPLGLNRMPHRFGTAGGRGRRTCG
ncbi:MAG: 50S ribosomal protein L32 [Gemmatimonadetes bacterium]|nr:50S ribosomal protein L32 [Gemmatimonadota bacterium]